MYPNCERVGREPLPYSKNWYIFYLFNHLDNGTAEEEEEEEEEEIE